MSLMKFFQSSLDQDMKEGTPMSFTATVCLQVSLM